MAASNPDPLAELEQLVRTSQDAGLAAAATPKHNAFFVFVGRSLTYLILFLALYIYRPDDNLLSTPIATLTLGTVLWSAAWVTIGFALIRYLFAPSKSESALAAWDAVGKLLLCAVAIGGFYLWHANH
jgi:hypothetical protein